MRIAQRIAPCLWFDQQAEEAAKFYVSVFKSSRIISIARYSDAGREIHGRSPGSVMTVAFELDGHHESGRAKRTMEAMLRMKKIDISGSSSARPLKPCRKIGIRA